MADFSASLPFLFLSPDPPSLTDFSLFTCSNQQEHAHVVSQSKGSHPSPLLKKYLVARVHRAKSTRVSTTRLASGAYSGHQRRRLAHDLSSQRPFPLFYRSPFSRSECSTSLSNQPTPGPTSIWPRRQGLFFSFLKTNKQESILCSKSSSAPPSLCLGATHWSKVSTHRSIFFTYE